MAYQNLVKKPLCSNFWEIGNMFYRKLFNYPSLTIIWETTSQQAIYPSLEGHTSSGSLTSFGSLTSCWPDLLTVVKHQKALIFSQSLSSLTHTEKFPRKSGNIPEQRRITLSLFSATQLVKGMEILFYTTQYILLNHKRIIDTQIHRGTKRKAL